MAAATEVNLSSDFHKGNAEFAFVDGHLVQKPSLPEHLKAVCAYEVFRVHEGKPCYLNKHLERLAHSCLSVKFSFDADSLKKGCEELIEKCALTNQNIKIILTRGEGEEAQHVYAYPVESFYPPLDYYTKGVQGKVIEYTRPDPTSKILDMHLKEKLEEAKAEGIFELLLMNEHGEILEGTRSNIFCIHDGTVHTAPDDRVIHGVTRDRVLELCRKANVPVVFAPLSMRLLKQSSSAFLTSTSNGILPFASVGPLHFDAAGDTILQTLMMDWFNSSE